MFVSKVSRVPASKGGRAGQALCVLADRVVVNYSSEVDVGNNNS